jgi:hypothetical protein
VRRRVALVAAALGAAAWSVCLYRALRLVSSVGEEYRLTASVHSYNDYRESLINLASYGACVLIGAGAAWLARKRPEGWLPLGVVAVAGFWLLYRRPEAVVAVQALAACATSVLAAAVVRSVRGPATPAS